MKDILRCSLIALTIKLKKDICKIKPNQKTLGEIFWLRVAASMLDKNDSHVGLILKTYQQIEKYQGATISTVAVDIMT